MIHTSAWTSRYTSHPIVFLSICPFAFPVNHGIVVSWVGTTLFAALLGPVISKFGIWWSETMWRLTIACLFFLLFLVVHLHLLKGTERCRYGNVCSWIWLLKSSFPVPLTLCVMLFYPVLVGFPLLLYVWDLVMRIVAAWARYSCW